MNQEIRKRVLYSTEPVVLAQQTADLARSVLDRLDAMAALDGSNGPFTDDIDCGGQDLIDIRSLSFAPDPEDGRVDGSGRMLIDWNDAQAFATQLLGNVGVVQFVDPPGMAHLTLYFIQASAGNTVTGWPTNVKWPAGTPPVITAAVGSVDKIEFHFDGTNYYGTFAQNFQ